MIRTIEALNFGCLRYVSVEAKDYQVLVGPNASGKSTLLDVIGLLGDMLDMGVPDAVRKRSPDPRNLFWMGRGDRFELAVEMAIPPERRHAGQNGHDAVRYEVAVGTNVEGELSILGENLWLMPLHGQAPKQRSLFPKSRTPPSTIVRPENKQTPKGWRKVLTKKPTSGNDYFISETTGWNMPFRLGPQKLALGNLPEDEERFPAGTWIKSMLLEGIDRLTLYSENMREAAPPGSPKAFAPDGSNLPWVVRGLKERHPEHHARWVEHLQTALPDLNGVDTVIRDEDRHCYLQLTYASGLTAPSWTISDGTLRLLALTLIAYLPEGRRIYLIEEPENGIHPRAVETAVQSLSSTYECQVFCASHSPIVLSMLDPEHLLCFAKDEAGATDIVSGSIHPKLKDWKGEVDLGLLFASGVLG